jgi:hypothetical protein
LAIHRAGDSCAAAIMIDARSGLTLYQSTLTATFKWRAPEVAHRTHHLEAGNLDGRLLVLRHLCGTE